MTHTHITRALTLSATLLTMTAIPAIATAQTSPTNSEIIIVAQVQPDAPTNDGAIMSDMGTAETTNLVSIDDDIEEIDFVDELIVISIDNIDDEIRDATDNSIREQIERIADEFEDDDFVDGDQ